MYLVHIHIERSVWIRTGKEVRRTKKIGLIQSTIITTSGSFIARGVGMLAMIFICNQMGAEGSGVYQLMMTVYHLAYMVASAGMITAVSKIVAEVLSKRLGSGASRLMRYFFAIGATMSMGMALLLWLYADKISMGLLQDTRTTESLKILAVSIPFMTVAACYKGYFYAIQKVIKPVSADVFEQIIKLLLITALLAEWGNNGIEASCIAVAVGIVLGEMISFLYLTILYFMDTGRQVRSRMYEREPIYPLRMIVATLFPLALAAYITGGLMTVENILIPKKLQESGLTSQEALSIYGVIKGMVSPILMFPASFLSAASMLLIPEIAKARTLGWRERVQSLTCRVLHFTSIVAMFIVALFVVYSQEIGQLLYHSDVVGKYMLLFVGCVPFAYIEMIADGVLKGLGEQKSCLYYHTLDAVGRVVLIYYLLPIRGEYALIGVNIGMSIVTVVLILRRLRCVTGIGVQWMKWFGYPTLAALGCMLTSRVMVRYLLKDTVTHFVSVTGGVLCAAVLYIVFLFLLESLTREDVRWLQMKSSMS